MARDLTYLDFDVLLERADQGAYRVRVVNAPAGPTPSSSFTVPFSQLELENFVLRIGRPRRVVRRVDEPETAAIKSFGSQLYRALFHDELEVNLLRSQSHAAAIGMGLRLRLRLSDTPELAELPWEFLYDRVRNRFVCLSDRTPLVRFLEVPDPPRPLPVSPPLRVLVMISSPHDPSFAGLDVEQEWAKLHGVLGGLERAGLIQLERLETATLGALRQHLRRDDWHVFHFIGHGGFDTHAQDGVLVLEDQAGGSRLVTAQALGVPLHNHDALRLVVLNACEGARADPTNPFAGTAQTLIQQGIPAVVAMQFEITDPAEIVFTSELYAAVADGYPLDAALSQARQAIYTEVSEVEWATPVLYLRAPDGRIFDVIPAPHPEERAREQAEWEAPEREAPEWRKRAAAEREAAEREAAERRARAWEREAAEWRDRQQEREPEWEAAEWRAREREARRGRRRRSWVRSWFEALRSPVPGSSIPPERPRPDDEVSFTAGYPGVVTPQHWYSLSIYLHRTRLQDEVDENIADESWQFGLQPAVSKAAAFMQLPKGTQLHLSPEVQGVAFNPPTQEVRWLEDLQHVVFRMQATSDAAGRTVLGVVGVRAGPLLVAQVPLSIHVRGASEPEARAEAMATSTARLFSSIFASYAHEDGQVVKAFAGAYRALGIDVLVDKASLRAGEDWEQALLRLIEEADLFQLFWSEAASRSRYVAEEWQHALLLQGRKGERLIRPLYWTSGTAATWTRMLPPPARGRRRRRSSRTCTSQPLTLRPCPASQVEPDPAHDHSADGDYQPR